MQSSQFKRSMAVAAFVAGIFCLSAQAQTQPQTAAQPRPPAQRKTPTPAQSPASLYSGVGSAPTAEDTGNLAWTSGPAGKDLPPGSGTAKQGAPLFAGRCSVCHGQDAEGVNWDPGTFSPIHGLRLGGGNGVPTYKRQPGQIVTLAYAAPMPTVLFNTIAVEMPMFRPGTLNPNQVYALTAFILFKNGIIKEEEAMNQETLPKVQMPNRNSFPASDDVYMDMKKRGCYKTYGVCLGN